jgi:alcohol dehydrogenase class IV
MNRAAIVLAAKLSGAWTHSRGKTMSDLIKHARAIADDAMGMEVGDRECVAQLIDEIERLREALEQIRTNWNKYGWEANQLEAATIADKALNGESND